MTSPSEGLQDTLWELLRSPNESDRNGEVANLVDGLFAIARAIHRLAAAVEASEEKGND